MNLAEIRDKAFAMPLTDPAYPKGYGSRAEIAHIPYYSGG